MNVCCYMYCTCIAYELFLDSLSHFDIESLYSLPERHRLTDKELLLICYNAINVTLSSLNKAF